MASHHSSFIFLSQFSPSYPFALTKFHKIEFLRFKGEDSDCFEVNTKTASFTISAPKCLELQIMKLILSRLKKPGTTPWV